MPRIDEETKMQRKERAWIAVQRRPYGISEAEVAAFINMGEQRRTVNNYLRELEDEGKVYKDGRHWFPLDYAGTRLRPFDLLPEEAVTLYLAARLLTKQQDKRNEPAETALYKLGQVLTSCAGVGQEILQAAQELAQRVERGGYQSIFRTVVRGYIYRKRVRIRYRPLRGQPFETVFATYLMEPSAIGFATYLIGHSSLVDDLRSYKLERIEDAAMIAEDYSVPASFPGLEILRNAWSIISGEETQQIVLRFTPAVSKRVLESQWHPSQDYQPDPVKPGYLRWWVKIAGTTDMLPWIRSWGSDCEVLEPEELRQEVIVSVHEASIVYQIATQSNSLDDRLLQLWGKTGKRGDYHPAFYHMLDVAHVAQQLLSARATRRWRQLLARALNTDADTLAEWLPYLIGLHDIGKLSVPFQILNPGQVERLKDRGFDFGRAAPADGRKLHHTIAGRLLLPEIAADWPDLLKTAFLEMIGGHHGIYQAESPDDAKTLAYLQEPPEWGQLRRRAAQLLQSYLLYQWPDPLPAPTNVSAAMVALNGFCILCDWLGSDETYFTPRPYLPLADYVLHSRQKAHERVRDAGFFQRAISHAPTTFAELFPFPPRPLQAEIDGIPDAVLAEPTLTIVEAPTGEGKTEAALALARRIAALRGTDEMYIALPTTATSNAMHDRIREHLEQRLGLPPKLVRLVHGQSFLAVDDLAVDPLDNGDGEERFSLEWFAPKKKALLAPFGVGTIDQAELAALNVRHNALRMIGLAGKVIILDEVHAYDTYMTTIIKRMLTWLAALGSSVILLSATLPKEKRSELVEAFSGRTATPLDSLDAYPSLLTVSRAAVYTTGTKIQVYQPNRTVLLHSHHYTDKQSLEKAEWLLAQVQEGGCACWITNTVGRAQAIYQQLRQLTTTDTDLMLLHGRFPLDERGNIEKAIKERYGKEGNRPFKGIVVGTQVLEQSLDLDFDVMMTDLAPIDLILQRAGRLHRHERDTAVRYRHATPQLYLNMEMGNADKAIYGEYILQMTAQVLHDRVQFNLPADYRPLIEAVYSAPTPRRGDPLYEAWDKVDREICRLEDEAEQRLTNVPDPDEPFYSGAKLQGFKEDEDSSAWTVAQTRWGQASMIVIPLMQDGNEAQSIPGLTRISLHQKADRADQLLLLRRSIRISDPRLVGQLKDQPRPKLFESALLKQAAPLWLTADVDGVVYRSHDFAKPVNLDPELGLVIGELS
jgi:CRISPR-associated endonuclease/helicase Cas3